ncbi:MAG: GGDEF domain-containing protein [Micavibrio sp.]|jgi:diguanylate cyclase|nr:MAG: GGDEF domain-containing protein [Micavibrio sp.]
MQTKETQNPDDPSASAWKRIEQEKLQRLPERYELWYRYYEGDPEICNAIDRHEGPFTDEICQEFYNKFISRISVDDAMRKINDHLQKALGEVAEAIGGMHDATSDYGTSLATVTDHLQEAHSIEDLEKVILTLAEDTKKMVEHNRSLEEQLENSSTQVNVLKESLDSVRHEAMTDGLTGLANRRAFDSYLKEAVENAQEEGYPLTLMMLDIDHFKPFNDNYGHQIGDQVLRLVARCLIDGVKGRDKAARYGGEEFAIILPETPLKAGIIVGDALRKSVESREVINRTNNQNLGKITLSVGVAELKPGETLENLISRADAALYTAKQNGRNQVAAAHPEG